MTLQDLLENSEGRELSTLVIFSGDDAVYDYKVQDSDVVLISGPDSYGSDLVSVYELVFYVEAVGLDLDKATLFHENTSEYYTTSTWENARVILK